jgi:hypothetical protein
MPENSVRHAGVVGLPFVEPEFWREVNLVTVRGRPHPPALGALVREAMRVRWFGRTAIAVDRTVGWGRRPSVGLDRAAERRRGPGRLTRPARCRRRRRGRRWPRR